MDLIDREEVRKTLYMWIPGFRWKTIDMLVDDIPSAQPERKKGEWIDQDQGAFYTIECSECHKDPLLDEYGDYVCSDFCPHCGADMKGGEE